MKKRFLIPAVSVAALASLAVLGNNIHDQKIASCNTGDTQACEELISVTSRHSDVTNPEFQAMVAKAQAAKEAANQPSADQALYDLNVKIETAAMNCEAAIKPTLKDPRSFRKVDHDLVDISDGNLTVSVSYISTNSFGGPARGAQSCTYSL